MGARANGVVGQTSAHAFALSDSQTADLNPAVFVCPLGPSTAVAGVRPVLVLSYGSRGISAGDRPAGARRDYTAPWVPPLRRDHLADLAGCMTAHDRHEKVRPADRPDF